MLKSGQVWMGAFDCYDATGAVVAADTAPTGTLFIDGSSNVATVTISGSNSPYKFSVTLPTLTAGQYVQMRITATVSTIATSAYIAGEVADTKRVSDLNDIAAGAAMDLVDTLKNKSGSSGYSRTTDSLEALGELATGNGGSLSLVYTLTDSTTGLPVSGATIELYTDSGRTNLIDSQTTSVLGQVTFGNLVAGTYYLKMIRPGYATGTDTEVVS